jgi:hypothetical protein
MKNTILAVGFSFYMLIGAFAQIDCVKLAALLKSTTFTTYIDGYYRADFAGLQSNNLTNFSNSNNALLLRMASFKIDKTVGKFSGTVDFGFGKRADGFSYNDKGLAGNI